MMQQPTSDKPLSGVTVVEISNSVAAPYTGWILAGLGANVIKVESGSGDDARQWGRMFPDGRSSFFLSLNGNKKSITLDLRSEEDRDWLTDFCKREADVVIQNMRPGKVVDLGIDGATMALENSKLIYCNLGAFGAVGPKKTHPGYDPLMQAFGGIMGVTGEQDRPPVRVGVSIVDMGSGMWCAIGILSALYRRTLTGKGCIIDGSLYETSIAWVANQAAMVQVNGVNPEKVGSGARGMAPYQAYECSDGYLVVAAPNDRLFHKLATALDLSEIIGMEGFATNQERYKNLERLNAYLMPVLKLKTRDEWQDILFEVGVPCAPLRQITEMLEDEQTKALGIVQTVDGAHPSLIGLPLMFDGVRPSLETMPPELGEHNLEIKSKRS